MYYQYCLVPEDSSGCVVGPCPPKKIKSVETKMSPTKCDARGSPRVFKAACMLFTSNGNIKMDDAMKLAGYTKREISCRRIRKSISKKKCRLQLANAKNNKPKNKKQKAPTVVTASTKESNVSDLTTNSSLNNILDGASKSTTKSAKVSVASGRKQVQPRKSAFAKVQIAKTSRRTPNQVKAADIERNDTITKLQSAYKWAVSEASNFSNKVELASTASQKFNVTVVPQTLRKLIREGRDQIMPPGPKPAMIDEDFKMISAAFCSYIALGQVNGDPEKKRTDLIAVLDNFLKGKKSTIQKHYSTN